jgi:hypothetical protein
MGWYWLDKTPTDALLYCKLVVPITPDTWNARMVEVMEALCSAWALPVTRCSRVGRAA